MSAIHSKTLLILYLRLVTLSPDTKMFVSSTNNTVFESVMFRGKSLCIIQITMGQELIPAYRNGKIMYYNMTTVDGILLLGNTWHVFKKTDAISSWCNIWSMTNSDIRRKAMLLNVIDSKPFVLLWLQHNQLCTEQKYFDIEEKELFSHYWLQGTTITEKQTDNLNSMIWECLSASHNRIQETERQINVQTFQISLFTTKEWLQRMGPSIAMYRAQITIKHSRTDTCQMKAVENRHTIMYHSFV